MTEKFTGLRALGFPKAKALSLKRCRFCASPPPRTETLVYCVMERNDTITAAKRLLEFHSESDLSSATHGSTAYIPPVVNIPSNVIYPMSRRNSQSSENISKRSRINWLVRPATLEDDDATSKLLYTSYFALLPRDYTEETLKNSLPKIA
jgi:hypothetical protein